MTFLGSRMGVARFVVDLLLDSRFDSASITITTRGTSEDCYVRIAIDTSLEDIALIKAQNYSCRHINTWRENIQDGSSLPNVKRNEGRNAVLNNLLWFLSGAFCMLAILFLVGLSWRTILLYLKHIPSLISLKLMIWQKRMFLSFWWKKVSSTYQRYSH